MSLTRAADDLQRTLARAGEVLAARYRAWEHGRVTPTETTAELDALFAGTLDLPPLGTDALLEHAAEEILPRCLGIPHPRYWGLLNSSPLPAAVVADTLVSGVNNNGGARGQSPVFMSAEREVIRFFAAAFGFPETTRGMLLPGGTIASLQAIHLAREAKLPQWTRDGAHTLGGAPRIYTSEVSHFSVSRAARVVGLAPHDVVAVPSAGPRGELDPVALAELVARDRAAGALPFCVAATSGATGTGALDDLAAIADVCAAHDLWFHVDACYGGTAVLVDELRPRFTGADRADSLAVDPHKWCFVPVTAGVLLVRDPALAERVYEVVASYIPDEDEPDPYRRGITTSRRQMGFTTWFTLRAVGADGIARIVADNCRQARRFERRLADAGFDVLPGGELSTVCARRVPGALDAAAIDALQSTIAKTIVDGGDAWLATTRHAGKLWLRAAITNIHTTDADVERVADLVVAAARSLGHS